MVPHNLPVYAQKNRILEALKSNQVVIVESPTGSGKTTQIPIILHEAGYTESGIIGITQPRRIAAVGVSRYIAKQLKVELGGYVGHKMRFEDLTTAETRLKVLTDGTLLQEMKGDRWLTRYSILMIDEAHERTLNIDFIMGLLKDILPNRPELRIIISSATLNPAAFSQYFNNAPIVSIDTPVYPIEIRYTPSAIEGDEEVLIKAIVDTVKQIRASAHSKNETYGDILVFCTGEKMIKETVALLQSGAGHEQLHVMPLYGRLGSEEQEKVFDPTPKGKTKVVIATNVAETSITINGISAVVDTGLAKINFYNPQTFTSTLLETTISRASADQRKGRAGRTCPGICYRLYSKQSYLDRPEFTREEIYRTDLAEVVLRMAEIGIQDFEDFSFISPPSTKGIHGAVETLRLLDALDDDNNLTDIGRKMTPYPLMPRHARMIVEATMRYPDVLKEIIIVAAFLSTNAPFLLPQGEEMEARKAHHAFRSEHYGDFASYLNLYWEYVDAENREKFTERHYLDQKIMNEILAITTQLEEITMQNGIPIGEGGSTEKLLKACARGLMPFVCIKNGRYDYNSVNADRIIIHPGSVLFRQNPEFIVAGEIVQTNRTYARSVSPLRKEWLAAIHPDLPGRLLGAAGQRGNNRNRSERKEKDTTNRIWIAGEPFLIRRGSGKGNRKWVDLEWKNLHRILSNAPDDPLPDFGTMRGTLLLNRVAVLPNSTINTILKAAKFIHPEKDVCDIAPRGNFHVHKPPHRKALLAQLKSILTVTISKKHKKMGFVALYNDGSGHYWFKSIGSFHGATSTSLESLEELIDCIGDDIGGKEAKDMGKCYRRLEMLLY